MRRTDDPILFQIRRARAKAVTDNRRSKSAPQEQAPETDSARRVELAPPPKVDISVPPPVPPVTDLVPDPPIKPFIQDVIVDVDTIPDTMIEAGGLLDFVLRRKIS